MLNTERVRELVQLYDDGWELPALAERYEVSLPTVSRVITGKTWAHVTGGRNVSRQGRITDYRAAFIEARLDQGCRNYSIIGRELGITRQAVAQLIRNRNIGGANCSAA
jgi:hypothetical protein